MGVAASRDVRQERRVGALVEPVRCPPRVEESTPRRTRNTHTGGDVPPRRAEHPPENVRRRVDRRQPTTLPRSIRAAPAGNVVRADGLLASDRINRERLIENIVHRVQVTAGHRVVVGAAGVVVHRVPHIPRVRDGSRTDQRQLPQQRQQRAVTGGHRRRPRRRRRRQRHTQQSADRLQRGRQRCDTLNGLPRHKRGNHGLNETGVLFEETRDLTYRAAQLERDVLRGQEVLANLILVRDDPVVEFVELFGDPLNSGFHALGFVARLAAEDRRQQVRAGAGKRGLHLVDGALQRVPEGFRHPRRVILNRPLEHVESDLALLLHLVELLGSQVVGLLDPRPRRKPRLHQLHGFLAGQLPLGENLIENQTHAFEVDTGEPGRVGHVLHEPFDVLRPGADGLHSGTERLIQAERRPLDARLDRPEDLVELPFVLPGGLQDLLELVLGGVQGDQAIKTGLQRITDTSDTDPDSRRQPSRKRLTRNVTQLVRLPGQVAAPPGDHRPQTDGPRTRGEAVPELPTQLLGL